MRKRTERLRAYNIAMLAAGDAQTFSHYPSWPAPAGVRLVTLPEQPCPYLPPRDARIRAFLVDQLDPEQYHDFMDAGFRRSGKLIYQPACRGCRECRPIRVCVDQFIPSKSQRRCAQRNEDLVVNIDSPDATDEKFDLYRRYMRNWHGRADADSHDDFAMFLYQSPVWTVEFTYRLPGGQLLAVGICDRCSRSLSSVYFYFDPAHARRSLGTFGALREIEAAKRWRLPHYYLGYYIAGCGAMRYKSSFRRAQVLDTAGAWRDIPRE